MSTKFSVRVNDPKGFSRAFKLAAATACKHPKWGGNLIVEHVLLRVSGFKALLLSTDLCQYLTIDLGLANCGQLALEGGDGELLLPSDWKVPNSPFTLEFEPTDLGPKVTLKYGAVESSISQEHAMADWPNFPLTNCGMKFSLPAAHLAHEFSILAPICAAEKGRYALNGIYFEIVGTKPENAGPFAPHVPPFTAQMVATNGKRLAAHALPVTLNKGPRFQPLLESSHAEKLVSIIKMLDSMQEPNVEVGFSPEVEDVNDAGETTAVRPREPYMFFGNRMWNYTIKMIDGQFPDWHSVVPNTDATVLLPRQEFIDALQAVKKACDEENTAVKLTFNAEHLLIEAKSPKNGYAKTQVSLSEVPPQMIIGLDPDYLLDALNALTGEWIVFKFRSADYGVELHDGAPELRYHLVMPIDLMTRPAEPKEPVLDEKEEVWDGKAGKYVAVTDEAKALAKTEFETLVAQYHLDFEAYKLELRQWRLAHRITGWSESEDLEEEQKHGIFTPRLGFPEIGAKLADHPSLEELAVQARAAEVAAAKPRRKAKPATNGEATPTTTAVSPIRASTEHTHEFRGPDEAQDAELEADQVSPESLGLTLNKNQWSFGW